MRKPVDRVRWTPEIEHPEEARKPMAFRKALLAWADDCTGQVLGVRTRPGLDQNTIFVYASDHNEMLGDLGPWNKFEFYKGSCGVPFSSSCRARLARHKEHLSLWFRGWVIEYVTCIIPGSSGVAHSAPLKRRPHSCKPCESARRAAGPSFATRRGRCRHSRTSHLLRCR